jgi:hypothetical protein
MSLIRLQSIIAGLALAVGSIYTPSIGVAQSDIVSGQPIRGAVLVELLISESSSSCPLADDLLRQINGRLSHEGQLVIGLSELCVTFTAAHDSNRRAQRRSLALFGTFVPPHISEGTI